MLNIEEHMEVTIAPIYENRALSPQLVNDLAQAFNWDVDVCTSDPIICDTYFEESSGLKQPWSWARLCWMMPPVNHTIGDWMKRALAVSRLGTAVICLVPANSASKWWYDTVPFASQIVFIKNRSVFRKPVGLGKPSQFVFVVFGEISRTQRRKLAQYGLSVPTSAHL